MEEQHPKQGEKEINMEQSEPAKHPSDSVEVTTESLDSDNMDNQTAHADAPEIHSEIISTPQSLKATYRFIKELGHGGQAKVFLAHRLSDGKLVTVKQLNIDSVKAWKEYELFHREAEILSKLNISGVARFYEAIECLEDRPACSYIIQEYIEGASLAQMLKDGHRFKTDEVYDILLQMLNILKHLQSMEPPVIHRDIKPSNIMISPGKNNGYKVTLIDFGAVANPQVQSGGSTVAGTYGYMPPEQLMGRPLPASDIYSLGAVAVELFSGVSPAQIQVKDFRLIFEPEVQQLPVTVVNTLRRMLEPKAEERLQNIPELIKIFTNYKNNNYEDSRPVQVKTDKNKEINKKLSEVDSVGSPGNMELWQGLQDNTPRAVPEVLVEYIGKSQNSKINNDKKPGWISRHPFVTIYIGLAIILLIACFVLLGGLAYFMVTIMLSIVFIIGAYEYTNNSDIDVNNNNEHGNKQNQLLLSDLIANGRKTVATIIDVDYLPVSPNEVSQRHDLIISKSRPSFRVKYKFNPPDDLRKEDLVHEYISHTSPETYYSKGDPLPILYKINKTYFGDAVVSMPYPFPLESHTDGELIYKSESFNYKYDTQKIAESIKDTYDYRHNVLPVLEARDRDSLLKAIKTKMWLLDDYEAFQIVLDFGIHNVLNTEDIEMREAFIESLTKIYHYAKKSKTQSAVSEFLYSYLDCEQQDLRPYFKEYKVINNCTYSLPSKIRSRAEREKLVVHSINELISKMHITKTEFIDTLFYRWGKEPGELSPSVIWPDIKYEGDFNSDIYEYLILPYLNQIEAFANIHYDESVENKIIAYGIDKSSYDYNHHYMPFIKTANNRISLNRNIQEDIWLIDRLDITAKLIQFGKENILSTYDYELRRNFIDALLKIYHYASPPVTKEYVINFIAAFLSNKIQGCTPRTDEIIIFFKYSRERDDLPSELIDALKVL